MKVAGKLSISFEIPERADDDIADDDIRLYPTRRASVLRQWMSSDRLPV
jgi:hypothetical protein